MGYFLVLSLFLLWLIVAVAAVLLTRRLPALQPAYPYVVRIVAWATIGIVLSNSVLVLGLFLTGRQLPAHPADLFDHAMVITWAIALVLGPLPASAAGWLGGAVIGVCLALFHQRARPS